MNNNSNGTSGRTVLNNFCISFNRFIKIYQKFCRSVKRNAKISSMFHWDYYSLDSTEYVVLELYLCYKYILLNFLGNRRKRREEEQVRYVQVSFFKSFPLGINLPSSFSSRPVFRAKFKTLFSFYARSEFENGETQIFLIANRIIGRLSSFIGSRHR